ncbi:MAG: CaiB/BaiF CoA-transferase family protein [Pseudomonadota bacterium]|nr:CaiB/BaiF CoA-transferase family protein [Pseudomonadota bacterium]
MTASNEDRSGPLTDLRVIEMGQLLAGPFCGQLLADFGAEVIKLEQPGVGDPMREWGRERADGKPVWFPVLARNKKSATMNAREPEGQEIIRQLVAKSDILIENFRPGTMERWNLGWDELSKINPKLVMVRVSGYGQTGPYSKRAGYGAIGEAMGGLRHVVGDPSTPPSRVGISLGDTLAATFAALGCMMAIHNVERTGRGQMVDSAIYEAVLGVMESLVAEYDQGGFIRERTGSILPKIAPSNVYPTRDGKMIVIGANQDTVFARLAEAMGEPELSTDARYSSHTARGEHQEELDDRISAWTSTIDGVPLEEILEKAGVPAGNIYRVPEMLEDAHFKAREAIIRVTHGQSGTIAMQNIVPKLSETPGVIRRSGPELGEHNDEVYRGLLGFDDARMKALADGGII